MRYNFVNGKRIELIEEKKGYHVLVTCIHNGVLLQEYFTDYGDAKWKFDAYGDYVW